MAEPGSYRESSNRLLRHKLQSLSRRLDELEEATKNIQKAEDELLELQDKIIQAEGSNSAMLAEADALRKRVLRIEGKDEEIKKAEDLCRLVKEKLENEESLTKDLKCEIEMLQKRMAELEKLEEAFSKSKTECTQLCLSLNEEKNLTKKLTTELETLRLRVKELEDSESRLDKTEKSILTELENFKSLTTVFVSERSLLMEKQKQDNKRIEELLQKVEQNNRLSAADQSKNATNLMERSLSLSERGALRIEDEISSSISSKESRTKRNFDYFKRTENEEIGTKVEHEKSSVQEDNKVKDLTQEIERLKNRVKQLQTIEEDLKKAEDKNRELLQDLKKAEAKNSKLLEDLKKVETRNSELEDKFLSEQKKIKQLTDQIEGQKMPIGNKKVLENGEVDSEEIIRGTLRQERTRLSSASKPKQREPSPPKRRERHKNRDLFTSSESSSVSSRKAQSLNPGSLKVSKPSSMSGLVDNWKRLEEKSGSNFPSMQKDTSISQNEVRKPREQPSVLSRYPPAANEQNSQIAWKTSKSNENGPKNKPDKALQGTRDTNQSNTEALSEKQKQTAMFALLTEKEVKSGSTELIDLPTEKSSTDNTNDLSNGIFRAYRSHTSSPVSVNGTKSTSYTEKESSGFSSQSEDSEEKPLELRISMPENSELSSEVTATAVSTSSSRYFRSRFQETSIEASSLKSATEEEPVNAALRATGDTSIATQYEQETKRPCSPRAALRTRAVIKPIIIDKDKKEVMGGTGTEMSTDTHGYSLKNTPSKMTSSITIYPSEPASPRSSISDTPKERHTSTTSIILPQNESPLPRSNISLPCEISISRNDIVLKPANLDMDNGSDNKNKTEISVRRSSITILPKEAAESNNNESQSDAATWRGHQQKKLLKEDVAETKNVTLRNTSRSKRSPVSLYDSKSKSEDLFSTRTSRSNRTSVLDIDGTNAKTNSAEPYTRRQSNSVDWDVTDELLRKSKRILNTSGTDPRRTYEPLIASGLTAWNQKLSPTREDSPDSFFNSGISPRDKLSSLSSERLAKTDPASRRQSVKLEVLQGRSGSPPRPLGSRRVDRGRSWSRPFLDN